MILFKHGDIFIPLAQVDAITQNIPRGTAKRAYSQIIEPTEKDISSKKKLRSISAEIDNGNDLYSDNCKVSTCPLGLLITPISYYKIGENLRRMII